MLKNNLFLSIIFATLAVLFLTFLLQGAFFLPRIYLVESGMFAFWNQTSPPDILLTALYLAAAFIFALLTGLLAPAAAKFIFRNSEQESHGIAASLILAAAAELVYAICTIILHGRVPAFFFPIYLDLAGSLPGWFIGYFLACGPAVRRVFTFPPLALLGGACTIIMAAVVIAPEKMPFYMASAPFFTMPTATGPESSNPADGSSGDGYVTPSFHKVPEP